MIYLKRISESIKSGIKNKQTIQEILCNVILWQWSDIQKAMPSIKKELSIENFLCAYLQVERKEFDKLMLVLGEYKDKVGKGILQDCLACRI